MKRIFGYFVPALIALASALGYTAAIGRPAGDSIAQIPAQVVTGGDYYVSIPLIELSEYDSDGNSWDHNNGTGPDIFYEIFWKGHRIFKSGVKEDSFVAKWSNVEVDVAKLALSRGTSIETLVQAARLNVQPGESIEVAVYDSDLMADDLAGRKTFASTDLKLGDTVYEFSDKGIKRLVLRVQDMSQLPDIAK